MNAPATERDTEAERNRKQGRFLQNGVWRTRKEIMVRARYGNDAGAVRRAIQAVRRGK